MLRSIFIILTILQYIDGSEVSLSPSGEQLLNRRAGENFLVICKLKDYDGAASDVKVDWYKDGKIISRLGSIMTVHTPYANQLLINRPKVSDSGSYLCKVEVDGETHELTTQISFVEPPRFVDPETEQHPEDGTDAEIKCKVEGSESLEIFWQLNGITLDENSLRGYEFKENKQTLVIPGYDSKKDDGVYNCNAAQHSSFETLSIDVTGYSRPQITVFDTPENDRGFEGQSAQLKCGAIGKPKPTYKWFNQEGEEITDSDKYKVEDGLLVIESLSSDDVTEYKCVAQNAIGESTRSAKLAVYLKPRIDRMIDITKEANEDVEIICRYSGEGEIKAKFVNGENEYEVKPEPVQVETASQENDDEEEKDGDDQDEESTTADNGSQEEVNPEVAESEEATTAETATSNEEAAEDDEDDDEAATTAGPTSAENEEEATTEGNDETEDEEKEQDKRWKRFVADVETQRVSVRAEGNTLILTLKTLNLEDAGAYSCLVENEAGVANRTTQLAITHAPVLKYSSESTIRSFDGNTVTIFCEVSAVPAPKFSWTKDGDEVEADGVYIKIDESELTTRLTLENNHGKHYGPYQCKADNGIGSVDKTINVMQIVAPATPDGVDCKQILYPNFGRCTVSDGIYEELSSEPTDFQFFVAELDDIKDEFDWEKDATAIKVAYDEKGMEINNLKPETQYQVRARAINEAGESELSEVFNLETSEAWAPAKPQTVSMECEETCTVSWEEPNDHGSPITGYIVTVQELKQNEESADRETVGDKVEVNVGSDETSVELAMIKPHSLYRIGVHAINGVNKGDEKAEDFETDDSPTTIKESLFGSFTSNQLIIIIIVGLVIIVFILDMCLFATKRRGMIACICGCCCGKSGSSKKDLDMETGRGESNRLLDNQAR